MMVDQYLLNDIFHPAISIQWGNMIRPLLSSLNAYFSTPHNNALLTSYKDLWRDVKDLGFGHSIERELSEQKRWREQIKRYNLSPWAVEGRYRGLDALLK